MMMKPIDDTIVEELTVIVLLIINDDIDGIPVIFRRVGQTLVLFCVLFSVIYSMCGIDYAVFQ